MKENLLYLGMGGVILFCLMLFTVITVRPKKEEELRAIVEGRTGIIPHENMLKKKIEKMTFYQKRMKHLEEMIQLTYDQERTPESVMRYQAACGAFGIAALIVVHIVFDTIILDAGAFLLFAGLTLLPDYSLSSAVRQKFEDFDRTLPSFLNNMLLAMQAGSGIDKAMKMSVETLEGNVKKDFSTLLVDSTLYKDDVSVAYMNLSRRIRTKDCERFCNVVISGLKNGNKMSDIFKEESSHLNKEQINKMLEKGNKNKLKATAISTGLIFMPLLVILIAPLMVTAI